VNRVAIGPGPFRTARGAGRFFLLEFFLLEERLDDEDFRRVWPPDDRVLEFLLRDAGGEDVRVAMLPSLFERLTSLTPHTPGALPIPAQAHCAA
jgi:hypothetical protein